MSLEKTLGQWTKPSSDTEQKKQERTERMIQEAISDHAAFDGYDISVYAKGSYPNNTNVKTESDVDIAVQCSDQFYYDLLDPNTPEPGGPSYTGIWTPKHLRAEIENALYAKFGSAVDTSRNIAINVSSSSARVDADVVPCFDLRDLLPVRRLQRRNSNLPQARLIYRQLSCSTLRTRTDKELKHKAILQEDCPYSQTCRKCNGR